jgi:hypothetical protein
MHKSKILLCALHLCVFSCFSQSSGIKNFLPTVFTGSPEAAGIAKYGNYDVNLYTGVPNISIPLYEIKVGELMVPISLNYHASGLKVNETPSWVGLGWSLSAGGQISRKIMGRPDEKGGGYLNSATVRIASSIQNKTQEGLDYLRFVSSGSIDTEPDIYSYNMPGKSGKFVFNQQNGNQPIFLPYDPVRLNRTPGSASFNITDEKGSYYNFATQEQTDADGGTTGIQATSSWMLSQIISANKQDTIKFNYLEKTGAGSTESYNTDYIVMSDQVQNYGSPTHSADFGIPYSSTSYSSTWWQTPISIVFLGGKVVFKQGLDIREDFNFFGIQIRNRLSAIEVYSFDANTGNYTLLKTIQLKHSYFINGADANTKRLRLDEVLISGTDGVALQKYKFEYNTEQQLPHKFSKAIDLWGYHNNPSNGDYTNSLVPRMIVPYQEYSGSTATTHAVGSNSFSSRDPDPVYMQACILKQIKYPTGGLTVFEYETNKYKESDNSIKYAGGLRIRQIKNYTDPSAQPVIKTYKYGVGETGYGRKNFTLNNYFLQNTQTQRFFREPTQTDPPGCLVLKATKRVRTFYASPTIEIEPFDGSPVGYSFVTEYIGDEINNTGRTVYKFNDFSDVVSGQATNGYGKAIINSYHFNRGQLTDKEVQRRNADGTYVGIAKTTNTYTYFPDQWNNNIGLIVFKQIISHSQFDDNLSLEPDEPSNGCRVNSDSYSYQYGNYAIRGGDNKITGTTDIVYDQTDPSKFVSTTVTYSYDDITHLQVKQIQTTNSKGQLLQTSFTYPHDFTVSPYTEMADNNIISKSVEETKTTSISGTIKPISHQKTNYIFTGNYNYLPGSIDFKSGNFPTQTRVFFNQYDKRGNILEMQKAADVKQAFIWGYNKTYPIATTINAKSNEIFHDNFEEASSWDGNLTAYDNTKSHTGRYSGRIDKPTAGEQYAHSNKPVFITLTSPTRFKYSGWVWSNAPATQIYFFMKHGQTAIYDFDFVATSQTGKWVYLEKELVVPADVTELSLRVDNDGGGTVWFDDIRLHPAASQMNTYTYDPLIGMTSQTDINNKVIFYDYDGFGRLSLVRDENKNILKKYCYNYQGQQEACTVNMIADWQSTGLYQCVLDGSGQNTGYQQRQERDNNSNSLSYNQLRWLDNGSSPSACPAPVTCNYSNCTQYEGYDCIYGVCEQGYRVNGWSTYNASTGIYQCEYRYEFSDGSWSQNYIVSSYSACPI